MAGHAWTTGAAIATLPPFAVTWDYLCPFARNAHEHVVTALRGGAGWDVRFVAFALKQVHVAEDEPPLWERPDAFDASGVLALSAGIVVRDLWPEAFLDAHLELFAARHDRGEDIRDPRVVEAALVRAGVDAAEVLDEVESRAPLGVLAKEHEAAAEDHGVFGVPTFVAGDDAVFVRLMHRPGGDGELARRTVERVVEMLVGWPQLNEFKHTRIPR